MRLGQILTIQLEFTQIKRVYSEWLKQFLLEMSVSGPVFLWLPNRLLEPKVLFFGNIVKGVFEWHIER